jgi:hypothetical protein
LRGTPAASVSIAMRHAADVSPELRQYQLVIKDIRTRLAGF